MFQSLLDTGILSEYLKGRDRTAGDHTCQYMEEHGFFTFTSVTVHEIVYGLELKSAFTQLERVLEWLSQNEEITPVSADYVAAARVRASAKKKGFAVELSHCLIAAVAARLDSTLVTGNTEDLLAIQKTGLNLALANWRYA